MITMISNEISEGYFHAEFLEPFFYGGDTLGMVVLG